VHKGDHSDILSAGTERSVEKITLIKLYDIALTVDSVFLALSGWRRARREAGVFSSPRLITACGAFSSQQAHASSSAHFTNRFAV